MRLSQANLASKNDIAVSVKKTDFDDKLKKKVLKKNLNKKVHLNKTKYLLVENELNELSEKVKLLLIKDYSFFLPTRWHLV